MSKELDIFQRVFDCRDIVKDIPYEYKKFKMTDRIYQDLMNGLKTNNNAKRWVKDKVNKILEPIVSIILKNGMLITAIHSRFEKKKDFVENVTIHGRNLNEIRSANVQSNASIYGNIIRWLFTY